MITFTSPDGKTILKLTPMAEKTRICVTHSPEKCQEVKDVNNTIASVVAERLFHRGWAIHE